MKDLTRSQLKNIKGGVAQSCSVTYQDSKGAWHTENGTCSAALSLWPGGTWVSTPFCSTASFTSPTQLSSNGGTSRCGAPFYSTV